MSYPTITAVPSNNASPTFAHRWLTAAGLSLASATLFLLLLAALHLLRPDLDPSWTVISAYALGEHGWTMTIAFASLAIACASLVTALWSARRTRISRLGRVGLVLLFVCGVGLAMAALFRTDPITITAAEATVSGRLHNAGASLGGLLPIAALLVSLGLSRDPAWSWARRSLWLATAVAWLGELVFVASMASMLPADGRLGPGVLIGWPNRLMIASYAVWLMVAAWHTRSRRGRGLI